MLPGPDKVLTAIAAQAQSGDLFFQLGVTLAGSRGLHDCQYALLDWAAYGDAKLPTGSAIRGSSCC